VTLLFLKNGLFSRGPFVFLINDLKRRIIKAVEGISTNLLLLNGLLIAALIIFFAWRNSTRMAKAPVASKSRKGLKEVAEELERKPHGDGAQVLPFERPSGPPPVMFNWNGHSWDAYEVLGLPAGSGMREVSEAYERAIERMDDESRAFLHRAYRAIKEHSDPPLS
jgi:hypothetical protein